MIDNIINNKYKIEQILSESHFYELYIAKELETNSTVVIKFLKKEWCDFNDKIQLFCDEVKSFAQVNHQYAVQILDLDKYNLQPYVVLEYIEGNTLKDHIHAGKVSLLDGIIITKQLAELLQYAHAHKIIKRTVKLSNVLIQKNGKIKVLMFSHPRLKLVAQSKADNLDETLENESGVQSDIFFLGTTLFECITRQSPLRKRGGLNELWDEILKQSIYQYHSFVTPENLEKLETFLEKAFTRQMKLRFSSYEAFLMAITDLQLAIEKLQKTEVKIQKQATIQLNTAAEVVDAINGKIPLPSFVESENCVNGGVIQTSNATQPLNTTRIAISNNDNSIQPSENIFSESPNLLQSKNKQTQNIQQNHLSNCFSNIYPTKITNISSNKDQKISSQPTNKNILDPEAFTSSSSSNVSYFNSNNPNLNSGKKNLPVSLKNKEKFTFFDTTTLLIFCSLLFIVILFFIL